MEARLLRTLSANSEPLTETDPSLLPDDVLDSWNILVEAPAASVDTPQVSSPASESSKAGTSN
jgi:hypothetical protein